MFNKGRMLPLIIVLGVIVAISACSTFEPNWEARDSYIVVTDNTDTSTNNARHLYVLDDAGAVIAIIDPLVDSMTGISNPSFVDGTRQIAFLSSDLPSDPATLHIIDRSGKKLYHQDGIMPIQLDGSSEDPLLAFTYNTSSKRILLIRTDDSKAIPYALFENATPKVYCPAIADTLEQLQAFQPAFSPAGNEIAFIHVGRLMTSEGPVDRADLALANKDGTNYRLLTGNLSSEETLPMTSWLDLFWSRDGNWIFLLEGTTYPEVLYVIDANDASIFKIYRDFFKSYRYVRPSPTGDTLLFGTSPKNADLYIVGYPVVGEPPDEHPEPDLTISKRITNTRYYDQPDWGPGGE